MTGKIANPKGVFFAFASKPVETQHVIEQSILEYRSSKGTLDLKPWTEMKVSGALIWKKIFEEIDHRPFFIADVTFLNPNVTYEIGYAIGRRRRMRLVVNSDKKDDQDRDGIGIYDVLGYSPYRSKEELIRFLANDVVDADRLHVDEEKNIQAPIYLFDAYEKSELVNHIKTCVKKFLVRFRSYDPQEQARLPVHEAIREVAISEGVVVSLVPPSHHLAEQHNFRAAFVAGLSHGMGKQLCIIQIGDEATPLDYRDFTDQCYSKEHVEKAIERFTLGVSPRLQSRVHQSPDTSRTLLEQLDIGGSVAENELQSIDDYYLDTDAYLRTYRGEVKLIIGRKGAGKTALFLRVRNEKRRRRKNIVVDLKPEGFKLLKFKERIVDALSQGSLNHVISAIWEYVLLLEITYKILEKDRDVYARDLNLVKKYETLRDIYDSDEYFSEGDFSERVSVLLDEISQEISDRIGDGTSAILSQKQVSELIYKHPIHDLRASVADYLNEKNDTWVLVDNLDKGWPGTGITAGDITLISSLFEALEKIARSLRQKGYPRFNSTVFLRADVYENLVEEVSDRGKTLPVSVDWSDADALKELVRRRLVYSNFSDQLSVEHIWEQLAVPQVNGRDTLDLLVEHSLFRPRALLDLIATCRSIAVNRRHAKVTEEDVGEALRRSSFQMIENINLELRDINGKLDRILYEFLGREPSLNRSELRALLKKFLKENNIDDVEEKIVDLLLWFGFLGIENEIEETAFIFDVDHNMNMMRALSNRKGVSARYTIHPAFRPALAVAESARGPQIRLL